MTGIDNMLSQYIKNILKTQLGKKMTSKIIQELDLWYQISLDDAIIQFEKLDRILTTLYGKNSAKALEKRFLKSIISTSNNDKKDSHYITITEPQLVQTILTIIEDDAFRRIFDTMEKGEFSFEKIVELSGISLAKPSAYRKMEMLVNTGLIAETGYTMGSGNRNVKTYKKTFDAIDIKLNHGIINVMMSISKKTFQNSIILSTVVA